MRIVAYSHQMARFRTFFPFLRKRTGDSMPNGGRKDALELMHERSQSRGEGPELRAHDTPQPGSTNAGLKRELPISAGFFSDRRASGQLLKAILKQMCFSVGLLMGQVVWAEQSFAVQGVCFSDHFDEAGHLVRTETSDFRMNVQGCRYQLRMQLGESDEDYRQVVGDGTTTFYLIVFESYVKRRQDAKQEVGENVATGGAARSPIPNLESYSPAGPLWLAYASACYFSRLEEGQPSRKQHPVGSGEIDVASGVKSDGGSDIGVFRVRRFANWELDETVGVPDKVVYFEPGFALSPRLVNGVRARQALPSPYSNGFTNSTYLVLQWTNYDGLRLPLEATYSTYWLKPNAKSSNDLRTTCVFRIKASGFDKVTREVEARPLLPGKTMMGESRFVEDTVSPKDTFSYMAVGRFPTEEEVKRSEAYLKAQAVAVQRIITTKDGLRSQPRGVRRLLILALLGVLVLMPCVYWLRRLLQTKTTH